MTNRQWLLVYRNALAAFLPAALLTAVVGVPSATARQLPVAFEAASVKPNRSGDGRTLLQMPPGRFTATNASLSLLIGFAYEIQRFRLAGVTDGLDARFDVVATLQAGAAIPPERSAEQSRLALQTLLADRFKMAAHRETREADVFALVMATPGGTPGPMLMPSATDCSPASIVARRAAAAAGRQVSGMCGSVWNGTRARFGGVSMAALAAALSPVDDRLVIDRTGLAGTWDAELNYTNQLRSGADAAADLPDLFTALREQLGIKLERAKAPVEFLVIDRVEPPTPD
jgi:uncharacterized protein (TIGR03435 family)